MSEETKKSYTNDELRRAIEDFRKANPGQTPVVGHSVERGTTITGMGPLYEDSERKQTFSKFDFC